MGFFACIGVVVVGLLALYGLVTLIENAFGKQYVEDKE